MDDADTPRVLKNNKEQSSNPISYFFHEDIGCQSWICLRQGVEEAEQDQ